MKPRKVLLLCTMFLFLAGFSGARPAEATDISEQCKADLIALYQNCASQCGRDFRCFLRCAINNFPSSCLD